MTKFINRNKDFLMGELETLRTDFSWRKLNLLMDYAAENNIFMAWDFTENEQAIIISVDDEKITIEL